VPLLFGVLRKELSLLMIYQALVPRKSAACSIRADRDLLLFLTFYIPCVSTFAVMLKTVGAGTHCSRCRYRSRWHCWSQAPCAWFSVGCALFRPDVQHSHSACRFGQCRPRVVPLRFSTLEAEAPSMQTFDFDSAITMHRSWKMKFHLAIDAIRSGDFDTQPIGDDAHCSLGQWLAASASELAGYDSARNSWGSPGIHRQSNQSRTISGTAR